MISDCYYYEHLWTNEYHWIFRLPANWRFIVPWNNVSNVWLCGPSSIEEPDKGSAVSPGVLNPSAFLELFSLVFKTSHRRSRVDNKTLQKQRGYQGCGNTQAFRSINPKNIKDLQLGSRIFKLCIFMKIHGWRLAPILKAIFGRKDLPRYSKIWGVPSMGVGRFIVENPI